MTADPFEALRQPLLPLQPDAAFAADLRRRLERELGLTPAGGTMSTTTTTVDTATRPTTITPYLTVKGAARAIDFYREAFGAVETYRMTGDDGRVGHAEISIGEVTVMLSDEHPEIDVVSPATLGGAGLTLLLPVEDVDITYDRAVAAGAIGVRPPDDQFYGERAATLLDPFGHRWTISHRLEDVSVEQIAERSPTYTVSRGQRPAGERPIGELGYFTLVTPDVDQAAAFYGALFGWQAEEARPSSGGGGHLYRHVENTSVPFGFHDDLGDRHPHLYYRVEDLQTIVARVRELGGEVLDVSEHPSGATARCRDDQGTDFDLWQAAPGY
jgi:PhnB protein